MSIRSETYQNHQPTRFCFHQQEFHWPGFRKMLQGIHVFRPIRPILGKSGPCNHQRLKQISIPLESTMPEHLLKIWSNLQHTRGVEHEANNQISIDIGSLQYPLLASCF